MFHDNKLLVMRRNKFGKIYFTLPGGGIELGESPEHALAREMSEETGLQLGMARLIFTEEAGQPYGTQYVYLIDYVGGEPALSPDSDEANITMLGHNLYEPMWLPLSELSASPFVSERLKHAILDGVKSGFPQQPIAVI